MTTISEQCETVRWYIDHALKADYPLTQYAGAMKALQDIEEQLESSLKRVQELTRGLIAAGIAVDWIGNEHPHVLREMPTEVYRGLTIAKESLYSSEGGK